MLPKHSNMVFPQWQGGGQDLSVYYGAKEFRGLYLSRVPVSEIAVGTQSSRPQRNGV